MSRTRIDLLNKEFGVHFLRIIEFIAKKKHNIVIPSKETKNKQSFCIFANYDYSDMEIQVLDKTFIPFINAEKINLRLKVLATQIESDMDGEVPVFIGVLNGSFMVLSDLVKHYKGACEMSFVKMASYIGTQSTNKVTQLLGLDIDVTNRVVILVEDIVDTGNTLVTLKDVFDQHKPKNVKIFTLCLKPEAYTKDIPLDYVGFEIENKFIVGYGMDYDKHGRNLSEIYQIK